MNLWILLLTLPELFHCAFGRLWIPSGFKHERQNAKYLLTSTLEQHWKSESSKDCLRIDIYVPENYDPLKLCLRQKLPGQKISGFHKDFKLRILNSGKKDQSISDILIRIKAVTGYVVGRGVSFVNGYFKDDAFYGTLVFRHFAHDRTISCSILPLHQLYDFADLSHMDEDQKAQFIYLKTVKNFRKVGANAIVACGDMHRNDEHDIHRQFSWTGRPSPTNVRPHKVRISGTQRRKRQAASPPTAAPPPAGPAPLPNSGPAPLPPVLSPLDSIPAKPTKEEIKANRTLFRNLGKFFKTDKHGTFYAKVCYIIDASYLERRFNNSPEEATLLLGGFVEITDWILRSTDWDTDGVPDNIGMRLLEINIQHLTRQLKQPEEKWGRADAGVFRKRNEMFNVLRNAGKIMSTDCDIRSGIGEVNVANYVIHEPGGCTACKHRYLTSFLNPYVEKFSPRGERLRLLYHQIRLLSLAFVHTKGYCANCSLSPEELRKSPVALTFENGDVDWGACIVEGDIQSRTNIPLNSFRLSVCSRESGMSCLKELATKENCLEFEPEESFCGNGLIEGDEECDCGTLATCAEQQCTCSPRSGRDPCRKLSAVESSLCFTLMRCRNFRFLYETGHGNGSTFLSAFNTFAEGTGFHVGGRRDDDDAFLEGRNVFDGGDASCVTWPLLMLPLVLAMTP